MARYATSFEEYVDIIATDSPHALILDWWRRLNLAIELYCKGLGSRHVKAREAERHIASDPQLGPEVAAQINELRRLRNKIAHEETKPISPDEAAQYAQKALDFIWLLAKTQSAHTACIDG